MAQTRPKPLPSDLEFYAKRIKEKANPNVVIADKINQVKDDEIADNMKEIDRIRTQRLLESVRQGTGVGANPVLAKVFEGKTTEQITDMLNTLTPEALENLTKLASRFDSNPLNQPVIMQQPERKSGYDEFIITILKELLQERNKPQPQQGITLEGVAALIQALNGGRAQAPPQAGTGGMSPIEVVKMVMEFNRPVQEQLRSKDKELVDLRLKEMEARMPPDLAEQIKYVKEMAPMLGLTGGQTNELDLRLEEMRENREVDMKRLDWEQKKWELEQENDSNKWEQITHLLEGPLGDVIKSFGNAGADRVRGATTKLGGKMPKPVQTQCPNCSKPIYVDANADSAVCGNCGAILQKQATSPSPTPSPMPPQPAPEPTHVEAPPAEVPAVQPAEQEEEQEEEEEEENEHIQRGGTGTVESEAK